MKLILSTACVLLSVAALADSAPTPLTADQLLANVVAQLPTKPITVTGELLVRQRRGVPIASFGFSLDAHWGAVPPRACYTIRDAFGRSLEQLTITHGEPATYRHATGDPLQESPLQDLTQPIQGTDLSWTDLTLAFLWWHGGKVVGEETIKTFDCHIIEIEAPAAPSEESESDALADAPSPMTSCPYSKVRLWISKKANLMLQAEGYDTEGQIQRRLWVRSCKKIDERWMIKDMEVQHFPMVHRTKLRVLDVTGLTPQSEDAMSTPEPLPTEPPITNAAP